MWRLLWTDRDIEICVKGTTTQFRFVVKCVVGSEPKVSIFEGGRWQKSTELELEFYLRSVEEWDAVVHHHQNEVGWVTTTAHVTRLSVLRN
jgi:hypothetical protein